MTLIFLGITTLSHLSLSWFELQESRIRLHESEKEKALYQLASLRAQINPHFLFNSLNSIYSLALQRSQQAPGIILKLSDVLRYVIYDSESERVRLKDELDFILKYIDLQKLRTDSPAAVTCEISGDPGDQKMAPLIFIIFIENAFKHGLKGDIHDQFIRIRFNLSGSDVVFVCENNIGKGTGPETGKGMGLVNVKKRLELLYGGHYRLDISSAGKNYRVALEIEL
jgi:sensor histidine kinase YesM